MKVGEKWIHKVYRVVVPLIGIMDKKEILNSINLSVVKISKIDNEKDSIHVLWYDKKESSFTRVCFTRVYFIKEYIPLSKIGV